MCQRKPWCLRTASPYKPALAPLIPLPIIRVPFEQVDMDLIRPLLKSGRGHKYIVVIPDYTTLILEVTPLYRAKSKNTAREFMLLFSRVRILKDFLMNLCQLLQAKLGPKYVCTVCHVRDPTGIPKEACEKQLGSALWWNKYKSCSETLSKLHTS